MTFLYPEFLFGLFALAIPIIVHLFNFRRAKKIYFSNTRFLRNIKKSTSQKLKLKHYLILLSRLLFLSFLVLAFAQPFLPSEDKNPQAESVYIYLDNSASMSNRTVSSATGLNQAIDYVTKVLDLYPTNTSYKLLTNDFAPFSNTLKSKDEIEELLTELKQSTISRTFPEAYTRLKSHTLRQSEKSKDVFIISDFQRSTIGNADEWRLDTADQVFVSPISFDATKNIFVDSIYLSSPYLLANEKNQLNVILKNTGDEDASNLPVKLLINELQAASSVVSIPANGTKELNFEIGYNLEKINQCRISFEDYPVTFDNDFYFVLKLEQKINVMEINNGDTKSSVGTVYGNKQLFNYTSQRASNTDYSLIGQVDLVILNGLQQIDNSLSMALNRYVDEGGSLFVIPGNNPDVMTYLSFVPSVKEVKQDTTMVSVSMPDLANPFYENIFENTDEEIEMPTAKTVFSWHGQQMDLLRLRNNLPFLSGFNQNGTIFILASPLEDRFTNFHRHALFVPVMYRMAAISKRTFEAPYYSINSPVIHLKIDSLNKKDIFKLTNQESELIPNQRINANELVLEMPKNSMNPGFYSLKRENEEKTVLAFNLDKSESYLAQMSMEEIKAGFSGDENVMLFAANDSDNFLNEVKKNKFGVPLWKYAIILSLIFLLAEVLLIRFL